jgi:HSP20 family molecular chaperone IbpA
MNSAKDKVETAKPAAIAAASENESFLQPPVDICEDAEGISLWADMPGVSKDSLNIQVDKDALLIEGEARLELPAGMMPLYADVRSTRYRRSFALSSEVDAENIEASIQEGVLRLRIQKRPELRSRKIGVRVS